MAADIQAPQMNAPSSKVGRFVGFAVVGASGLVVNQMALWFLTSKLGVYYCSPDFRIQKVMHKSWTGERKF